MHKDPEWEPGQGKQPGIQEGPFPNWLGQGGREQREEGKTGDHSLGCSKSIVLILRPSPLLLFELSKRPVKQELSLAPFC